MWCVWLRWAETNANYRYYEAATEKVTVVDGETGEAQEEDDDDENDD